MKSLKWKILMPAIFMIILMVVLMGTIINYYSKKIILKENEAYNLYISSQVLDKVKMYDDFLKKEKELKMKELEMKLKTLTMAAYSIVEGNNNLFLEGLKTEEEAKELAFNSIRNMLFDKSGYMFVYKTNGDNIVYPVKKDLEGTNFINVLDTKGTPVIKNLIDIAVSKGEGSFTYYWSKPNKPGSFAKYTYVKYFKEWDIIIGTGEYIDDINTELEKLKETGIKKLNDSLYEFNLNGNYPFIKSRDGKYISYYDFEKIGTIDLSKDLKTGENLTDKFFTKKDGVVEYHYSKNGKGVYKKLGYVKYFEPMDWIIVYSVYEDDLLKSVSTIQKIILIVAIVSVFVMILLLSSLIGIFIKPIRKTTEILKDLAEGHGDLTVRIPVKGKDEVAELSMYFNKFIDKISLIILKIRSNSETLASSTEELSITMQEIADRSNSLADNSSNTSAAIQEMAGTINLITENAKHVTSEAEKTSTDAGEGGEAVNKTMEEMNSIKKTVEQGVESVRKLFSKTNEIGEIVVSIKEIASQTNLLALNAAIEAARAGEAGRGFEVVAEEVRKLAEKTTMSTKEIEGMIKEIQKETNDVVHQMEEVSTEVEQGVLLADEAGNKLDQIVYKINGLREMINTISSSTQEQAIATEEIAKQTENITFATTATNSSLEESAVAIKEVSEISNRLKEIVDMFTLSNILNDTNALKLK